jgi:hypothetical protein
MLCTSLILLSLVLFSYESCHSMTLHNSLLCS